MFYLNIIIGADQSRSCLLSETEIGAMELQKYIMNTSLPATTLYDNSMDGEQVVFYDFLAADFGHVTAKLHFFTYTEHLENYYQRYKLDHLLKHDELKMTFLKDFSSLKKDREDLVRLQNTKFDEFLRSHAENELLKSRHGRSLQVYRADIPLKRDSSSSSSSSRIKKPRYISVGVVLNGDKDRVLLIPRGEKPGLIFPKGGCDSDEYPLAGLSALRETWEEAGAICRIERELFGNLFSSNYSAKKAHKNHSFSVYQMSAVELKENWPEAAKRKIGRIWFSYEEARDNFTVQGRFDRQMAELYLRMLDASELSKCGGESGNETGCFT